MEISKQLAGSIAFIMAGLLMIGFAVIFIHNNKMFHPFYLKTIKRSEDPFWFWGNCATLFFVGIFVLGLGLVASTENAEEVLQSFFSSAYVWPVLLGIGGAVGLAYTVYGVLRRKILWQFGFFPPFLLYWMRHIYRDSEPVKFWAVILIYASSSIFAVVIGAILFTLL